MKNVHLCAALALAATLALAACEREPRAVLCEDGAPCGGEPAQPAEGEQTHEN